MNKQAGIDFKQLSLLAKINENQSGEVLHHLIFTLRFIFLYLRSADSLFFFSSSCGRDGGRGMKLLWKCLKFVTGPREKAETSMRSIPNSGCYFSPGFCSMLSITHFSVCIVSTQTLCFIYFWRCCISVYVKPSVGVSLSVCLSLLGSTPGYFPTRMSSPCWEHVSLHPPLTQSSSHTGCLMAPSTTCCMKAPVSTFPPLTKTLPFVLICCTFVHVWFHYHVGKCVSWNLLYVLFIFFSDFVVDQTQAVKFALDIACGMAFLHTLEPMIPRHYLNSKSVMVRGV